MKKQDQPVQNIFDTKLSIVVGICTSGRNDLLLRLLKTLGEQRAPSSNRIQVVVVGNDVSDTVNSLLSQIDFPFSVAVVQEARPGVVRARNTLFDAAEEYAAEWLVSIDDDTWLAPGWLEAWIEGTNQRPADILIGPTTLVYDATVSKFHPQNQFPALSADRRPAIMATVNYAIHKSIFHRTDGLGLRYDMALNHCGGEGTEMMFRAIRQHSIKVLGWPHPHSFEERTGRRGELRTHLKRVMQDQIVSYRIAALHRRLGLLQANGNMASLLVRRTCRYLVEFLGLLFGGIAKLIVSPDQGQRMIGKALEKLVRFWAVIPFVMGLVPQTYGVKVSE